DQHDHVTQVLELAQLPENDRVAEMDVGCRGVDPELHPQPPAGRELALELALRQAVDCVASQPRGRFGRFHGICGPLNKVREMTGSCGWTTRLELGECRPGQC